MKLLSSIDVEQLLEKEPQPLYMRGGLRKDKVGGRWKAVLGKGLEIGESYGFQMNGVSVAFVTKREGLDLYTEDSGEELDRALDAFLKVIYT
ncbi:hypothetical protein IMZ31_21965 (plasmid) [Pontibacillus sp. ALD_SL1]|uniref:hypothetical protein n=1 Tax=Pontibacillus sp. ALD_SL1 TaxID=2777185 RepID=UPI001A963372|nr:hypothetical protein [Pontibacillus sp. ALD_SL1]QST02120.1 hypothetical protein IMZ31_21965 [Pontibacillus sp. ALD_SL1]